MNVVMSKSDIIKVYSAYDSDVVQKQLDDDAIVSFLQVFPHLHVYHDDTNTLRIYATPHEVGEYLGIDGGLVFTKMLHSKYTPSIYSDVLVYDIKSMFIVASTIRQVWSK